MLYRTFSNEMNNPKMFSLTDLFIERRIVILTIYFLRFNINIVRLILGCTYLYFDVYIFSIIALLMEKIYQISEPINNLTGVFADRGHSKVRLKRNRRMRYQSA